MAVDKPPQHPDRLDQRARAEGSARITQITRTTRIGQQFGGDLNVFGPGTGPAPTALYGLPDAPVALVGRAEQVEVLSGLLGPAGTTPVAVVAGLAGVGKSALALTVAQRAAQQGWFPGGVLYVPLNGYAPSGQVSPGQAVAALLRALGIRDADLPPTYEEHLALYRSELAGRAAAGQRVLVVADDAGDVAQVRPLVPAGGGGHRLLVTSRHGLVAPDFPARLVDLDELSADAATELITGTLLRTRPADPRPERDRAALAEIATYCGRLPLALTVVAARLAGDPGLSPTTLAEQLADTRTRLAALHFEGPAGGLPVGVRAAFDLSYRCLAPDEARLLRLLTVNPGADCSTEAATALDREPEWDTRVLASALRGAPVRGVRELLAALATASLVTEQPVGSGRWRMHDLVRLYAAEQGERAARTDGRETALSRLLRAYREATEAAVPQLQQQAGRSAALAWLQREHLTLIALVALSEGEGRTEQMVFLATALLPYLDSQRHFEEALAVGERALAGARVLGEQGYANAALLHLGNAHREVRDFERSVACLEEATAGFRVDGFLGGEGMALASHGCLLAMQGRHAEAVTMLEWALDRLRRAESQRAEVTVLVNLGLAFTQLRRFSEAVEAHEQAAVLSRRIGDMQGEADSYRNLGLCFSRMGRLEEARAAVERGLGMWREVGDQHSEGLALAALGLVAREHESYEEAAAAYEEAAALLLEAGDEHRAELATRDLQEALALAAARPGPPRRAWRWLVRVLAAPFRRSGGGTGPPPEPPPRR
ncbi:tetratricopeptide repeat protein [Streptomyces sp. NBC_01408]|uniref:tetratricopeptide repeat protein n=1 Tax=Streptomyces sp. NBC_01408 TaxID=2903855 RepID=UPI002251AFA0|nr:tetratricopeptide repeat protein [Streptomyces sp. NBC_01408]MCX4691768.1 tetratricopeptide repeat protein [Streptomyces sp. NBC_01408]